MGEERGEHRQWRMPALVLLLAGGLGGYLSYTFARGEGPGWSLTDDPFGLALAAAAVGAMLGLAFTLERQRWHWALMFSAAAAVVAMAVVYWNGPPAARNADLLWRYAALLLSFAAAVPLFNAMRDEGRWRFPYVAVHWYAWTSLTAALAVALIAAAIFLLFRVAGVDQAGPATWSSARPWTLSGAFLAMMMGLMRSIANTSDLQLWLRRLLSLLAPVMLLVVLALPLIAARTPSLAGAGLALALGAILFTNAVLGNGPEQQSPNPVLRYSAAALGPLPLPLAIIAGVALWVRIDQHGYTPTRLWAAVFALGVAAIGIRYLAALLRRRRLWAEPVRRNNIRVLGALFFLGLLLATPLVSFSAMSTRDQLARLQEGRLAPVEVDWGALRFQFGRPGMRALQALREGVETSPEVRSLAARALLAQDPAELPPPPARHRP